MRFLVVPDLLLQRCNVELLTALSGKEAETAARHILQPRAQDWDRPTVNVQPVSWDVWARFWATEWFWHLLTYDRRFEPIRGSTRGMAIESVISFHSALSVSQVIDI